MSGLGESVLKSHDFREVKMRKSNTGKTWVVEDLNWFPSGKAFTYGKRRYYKTRGQAVRAKHRREEEYRKMGILVKGSDLCNGDK